MNLGTVKYLQIISQVVLLQRMRFKAMGHCVKVVIPYTTDKTFGLKRKEMKKMYRGMKCFVTVQAQFKKNSVTIYKVKVQLAKAFVLRAYANSARYLNRNIHVINQSLC